MFNLVIYLLEMVILVKWPEGILLFPAMDANQRIYIWKKKYNVAPPSYKLVYNL